MKRIALIMPLFFCSLSLAQTAAPAPVKSSSSIDSFKLEDANCNCRNDQKKDFVDISEIIERQVQEEGKRDPNAQYLPPKVGDKKYKEDMVVEQGIAPGVNVKGKASKKKFLELSIKPGEIGK